MSDTSSLPPSGFAALAETVEYEEGIYQIATTDPVQGGPGGVSNYQAQGLANRTAFLSVAITSITASLKLYATTAALDEKQDALGYTPVQQGEGPNQTTDTVSLGQDTTYTGLIRVSIAGTDKGNLLSGTYGATIEALTNDLPGLGLWYQRTTQRPAFTYQNAAGSATIIDLPNQEDVQTVQSNLTSGLANQADINSTLSGDISNCVSGIYGKGSGDYQILGFYQQGSTGRPVAVFNNGTDTVYNGIANYTDVTAEASAREAADATLQSNLTAAQAAQADENSTLSADISNCVSGIYGKSSSDYQLLGLYQQSTTGRPIAVFNNGTTTVYNGIANYADVTAETSAREAADATIQSNLTAAQAAQADENSTLSADISNCVSGIYGKGSSDYQILGFYQQGSTGRPVAVFNNGSDTVYNGIANYTDITAEASARETADATLQSNLTAAQASQADQNSEFASEIASRILTNASNDGVNAPIEMMNLYIGTGMLWFSANGGSYNVVQTNPGTGWNSIQNATVYGKNGALTVLDTTGTTNNYSPSSIDIVSDTTVIKRQGSEVTQYFEVTLGPATGGGQASAVVDLPVALTTAILFAKGNALSGTKGTTYWIPSVNVFPTSLSQVTVYADNLQAEDWTNSVTVQVMVVGI